MFHKAQKRDVVLVIFCMRNYNKVEDAAFLQDARQQATNCCFTLYTHTTLDSLAQPYPLAPNVMTAKTLAF